MNEWVKKLNKHVTNVRAGKETTNKRRYKKDQASKERKNKKIRKRGRRMERKENIGRSKEKDILKENYS